MKTTPIETISFVKCLKYFDDVACSVRRENDVL